MFILSSHTVPPITNEIRLSDYCQSVFEKYIPSRKGIKKAFKRGEFYVDDKIAHSGDWVNEGQNIELRDLELNPPQPYELNF